MKVKVKLADGNELELDLSQHPELVSAAVEMKKDEIDAKIAQARATASQAEKAKLYGEISNLKSQIEVLKNSAPSTAPQATTQAEPPAQTSTTPAQAAPAPTSQAAENGVSSVELVRLLGEQISQALAPIKSFVEQSTAEKMSSYRMNRLNQLKNSGISIIEELVSGNNEAEIEASIANALTISSRYFSQAPAQTTAPATPPATPPADPQAPAAPQAPTAPPAAPPAHTPTPVSQNPMMVPGANNAQFQAAAYGQPDQPVTTVPPTNFGSDGESSVRDMSNEDYAKNRDELLRKAAQGRQ